jgi:hypothetical protein
MGVRAIVRRDFEPIPEGWVQPIESPGAADLVVFTHLTNLPTRIDSQEARGMKTLRTRSKLKWATIAAINPWRQ